MKLALGELGDAEKAFDLGDLGFGQPDGGNDKHFKARWDLLQRVVGRFPDVPHELVVNLKRDFGYWDRARRTHHNYHWGKLFLHEMNCLLQKRVPAAEYLRKQRLLAPKAAICA